MKRGYNKQFETIGDYKKMNIEQCNELENSRKMKCVMTRRRIRTAETYINKMLDSEIWNDDIEQQDAENRLNDVLKNLRASWYGIAKFEKLYCKGVNENEK